MDKYAVIRITNYGNVYLPVLASTLLFSTQEYAEDEARKNAITYGGSDNRWEVHHLTEPVFILQPTEADTQGAV